MITIGMNGQHIAYGIKHFNLDTPDDLKKLQLREEVMGSTCFVISTSKYYMLNSQRKWVEITPFGKLVDSDGDSGSDLPGDDDSDDNIVYEGGVI